MVDLSQSEKHLFRHYALWDSDNNCWSFALDIAGAIPRALLPELVGKGHIPSGVDENFSNKF